MDEENLGKQSHDDYKIGQETADMSIAEIDETLEALKAEITRLEQIKSEKSSHLAAADALFK